MKRTHRNHSRTFWFISLIPRRSPFQLKIFQLQIAQNCEHITEPNGSFVIFTPLQRFWASYSERFSLKILNLLLLKFTLHFVFSLLVTGIEHSIFL